MKRARREQGITQNELAAQMQLLGVDASESRVQKLESGVYEVKGIELLALSRLLCLDLASRAALMA